MGSGRLRAARHRPAIRNYGRIWHVWVKVKRATEGRVPSTENDRVRRQACLQAVLVRSIALSVTTSLRMQAVNASLAGFPASRSRR